MSVDHRLMPGEPNWVGAKSMDRLMVRQSLVLERSRLIGGDWMVSIVRRNAVRN